MNNNRLVIVDGVRTPFCRVGSDFGSLGADELGRLAADALLTRTGLDPGLIDEVIFGCVAQPAESANIARVIALRAGIPESVPAATVHRNCASGFEAITTAAQRLAAGQGSVFLVGGTESMSQVPLLFQETTARKFAKLAKSKTTANKLAALTSFRFGDFEPRVGLKLGLTDPVCGLNMGETAELLASEGGITREAQDAFAIRSHERAVAAEARLAEEICPVYLNGKAITRDNGPRKDQTPEVLAGLRPVFQKYGSVTAGNSSQVTDGAVALLVMSEQRAAELGLKPLGALTAYAYAGCDPARMGLGPVFAIDRAAKRSGLMPDDADVIEINEAFAAQVLAVLQRVPVPDEKLNVNGGSIALGHPVGATGARLVLTALKELQRRDARRALVTLCVGGGQGGALWLERI
jgi:acetyl-CoA C-acetyltransferase/acetyl-CoA acyltransferase